VNECHFDHTGEIFRGFLEPREDTSALLEPTNQAFHDVSLSIRLSIEGDRTGILVFVGLRGNNRFDFQIQQTSIDPIGSIPLVTSQGNGPSNRLSFTIDYLGVGTFEHGNQGGGFVVLPSGQMKEKWMAMPVAEKMNFRRKTPARTA
jgi:hypothetical protein